MVTKAMVRKKAHKGVDRVMDRAEDVQDGVSERIAMMKEKAMLMRENANDYIKENPEKSVLFAAGVGAVLGVILTAAVLKRR